MVHDCWESVISKENIEITQKELENLRFSRISSLGSFCPAGDIGTGAVAIKFHPGGLFVVVLPIFRCEKRPERERKECEELSSARRAKSPA